MTKRVLDVGNCGADHGALTQVVCDNFDATVEQAHGMSDALEALRDGNYDLVTINRLMDRDGSEGIEIIRAIKSDAALSDTPVLLITNFDEHQKLAVDMGAQSGFGKSKIFAPETVDALRPFLS